MRLHHRFIGIFLAILMLLGPAAQASGVEFTASDPVLYVDERPVFILEDLSAKLGARWNEDDAVAWLDVYAGEATALTSAIGVDAGGIFAALSGIPSAYGLSGSSLAALTGAESSQAALKLFSPEQLSRELSAGLDALLAPLVTGETETIQVALSSAATKFECARVSGEITSDNIVTAMTGQSLLRGVAAFMQTTGMEMPDAGALAITGAYGFSGEASDKSALYRIALTANGTTYDAEIIIDNSAAITSATIKINGGGHSIEARCEKWPTGYRVIDINGGSDAVWLELEQIYDPASGYRMGGGVYDSATGKMISATVILDGEDCYAAVSTDENGSETALYLSTDTEATENDAREGIFTLGLYQGGTRTELQGDLTISAGETVGDGRRVDAAYATDILIMTPDDWNSLAEKTVNTINGAMYVLSMYVPGFTYEPIDSLDPGALMPETGQ